MSYLLDTNVVSELTKDTPDPSVVAWLGRHQEEETYLSVITIGELQQGIVRLPSSRRKTRLSAWLSEIILTDYAGAILPIDTATMLRWGRLSAEAIIGGQKMPVMDALIAATAIEHQLILVTRNVADFENTPIDLVNPWEETQ